MKLYELLKAADLRHSDQYDDYQNWEIVFVEDGDVEVIPAHLRAILRCADCYVNSIEFDTGIRDDQPKITVVITNEPVPEINLDLIRHQSHLLK